MKMSPVFSSIFQRGGASMPKPLQTQWDFGNKAASSDAPPERRVFSVAELTAKIRTTLEASIGFPWVSGEITNLRLQTSGHTYFTHKDPDRKSTRLNSSH